jgi:hypothetical protein
MARLIVGLAVIVVALGLVGLGILLGRIVGRKQERKAHASIDASTYYEMTELLRVVFGAQSLEDPAYIPDRMRERAAPVMKKINAPQRRPSRGDGYTWYLPS